MKMGLLLWVEDHGIILKPLLWKFLKNYLNYKKVKMILEGMDGEETVVITMEGILEMGMEGLMATIRIVEEMVMEENQMEIVEMDMEENLFRFLYFVNLYEE